MGLKGLPAKFGGLQSDAEEIGSRLVKKGHEVSVYCRKWYTGKINQYKGMTAKNLESTWPAYLRQTTNNIIPRNIKALLS